MELTGEGIHQLGAMDFFFFVASPCVHTAGGQQVRERGMYAARSLVCCAAVGSCVCASECLEELRGNLQGSMSRLSRVRWCRYQIRCLVFWIDRFFEGRPTELGLSGTA